MNYRLDYTNKTNKDIEFYKKSGNKPLLKKLLKLLIEISKDPYTGNGKPEQLKHQLSGLWSRRLNKEPVGVKKKLYSFIPSYMIGDDLIVSLFDKIKEQRKREQLNKLLNEFDKNILEFDIINNKPRVFLENREQFQDVSELGHGLKRYIAIISSILINKDGILFLDEIENGIHYSHLDKLWEIILTISKQQNVQVFATTHSKECIESYARVAKRLEDEEITFIELGLNDENKIESIIYPYEWLIKEVSQNHEVRGW